MSETRTRAENANAESGSVSEHPSILKARFHKHRTHSAQSFVLEVDFEAASGFTILFGASGAGKTTLLDCVAGLIPPDSGQIQIGARRLFDSVQNIDLPVAKRRTGYVFQGLALFPHMTVEQNVMYGLNHLPQEVGAESTQQILQAFRIAHLARRKVSQISGGESHRVALARTLVTDPEVLLLDEPLAALDAPTKAYIIDDLREWNRIHQIPILYVTHGREEVFALGERVIVLQDGRIVAQGTPHEVMTAPRQETVAQLAGFENIFDAVVEAAHPERGTMVCRLSAEHRALPEQNPPVFIETPLVRAEVGSELRVGIRAGDILLAVSSPAGLSARNAIPGQITAVEQRDLMIIARVDCGVEMEVHVTLAARDSLDLKPGRDVWLVIKTHSCHLMQKPFKG
ncbi:MAG TPA: molybdenum ABC transporter ATP-binding protein [Candidatus Acidoferrales bacterium]|nr:molybdenum ABC transporter ATP-binding protein [Candidatus Acidoferrales bacterium]